MTREQALPYVSYYLDDALSDSHSAADLREDARLVVRLDEEEAIGLAEDYLSEIGWFAGEPPRPDYIL